MQVLYKYLGVLGVGAFFIALATGLTYASVQLGYVSLWLGVPAMFLSIWAVLVTGVAFQVHHEGGGF